MKAVTYSSFGPPDVLRLTEFPKPEPKDKEVLVAVHAASVNAGDWHVLRGKPMLMRLMGFGLLKPRYRILGADVAGRVEAVGKSVTQFRPGDEVFGDLAECGFGAFAEYATGLETAFALKPSKVSFEEAAATPAAGMTALQGLRNQVTVSPGQKVLINGASGGVGTFAVQIAKALGAEVTAVCSARNVVSMRRLGADTVIDYAAEDFTQSGRRYDLILAANGYHPISHYRRALTPEGSYIMTGGSTRQMFQAMLLGPLITATSRNKMANQMMKPNHEDLLYLRDLLADGKIIPVIDRQYSLDEVPEAIRYLEEGHARGKIVIKVAQT